MKKLIFQARLILRGGDLFYEKASKKQFFIQAISYKKELSKK